MQPTKSGGGPHTQAPAGAHSGSPLQVQRPAVQPSALSESQTLPQLPQLFRSEVVFAHVPEQHWSVPAQTRPHAPQFPTSVLMLAQVPEQQRWLAEQPGPVPQPHVPIRHVSPAAHAGEQGTSAVHDPPMHASPGAHAFPQKPQLVVLVPVSTHEVPQQVAPLVQVPDPHLQVPSSHTSSPVQAGEQGVTTHAPSTHSSPGAQRMPHPPQLAGLLSTSTHAPPQQISVPVHAGPVPQRQTPVLQTLPRGTQFTPQVPQSRRLLVTLAHAPIQHIRPPSHPVSGAHSATHAPPRQTVIAGQVIGQPTPTPPSVAGGVPVSGIVPSVGDAPPSSKPPP